MPKLTLEQRRRETLRRQLYGKEENVVRTQQKAEGGKTNSDSSRTFSMPSYQSTTPNSDLPPEARLATGGLATNYLTRDLTKILIFSSLAIATQISLFFLLQNHLVKLPF